MFPKRFVLKTTPMHNTRGHLAVAAPHWSSIFRPPPSTVSNRRFRSDSAQEAPRDPTKPRCCTGCCPPACSINAPLAHSRWPACEGLCWQPGRCHQQHPRARRKVMQDFSFLICGQSLLTVCCSSLGTDSPATGSQPEEQESSPSSAPAASASPLQLPETASSRATSLRSLREVFGAGSSSGALPEGLPEEGVEAASQPGVAGHTEEPASAPSPSQPTPGERLVSQRFGYAGEHAHTLAHDTRAYALEHAGMHPLRIL